jgi:hypothetical protein
VRSALVLAQFGSWSRMVNLIKGSMPALWAEIEESQLKPEIDFEEYDPLEKLASKTTSKAL